MNSQQIALFIIVFTLVFAGLGTAGVFSTTGQTQTNQVNFNTIAGTLGCTQQPGNSFQCNPNVSPTNLNSPSLVFGDIFFLLSTLVLFAESMFLPMFILTNYGVPNWVAFPIEIVVLWAYADMLYVWIGNRYSSTV